MKSDRATLESRATELVARHGAQIEALGWALFENSTLDGEKVEMLMDAVEEAVGGVDEEPQALDAGKLKAKYVIHAVGPRMGEGDEDNKLKSAMNSVLGLATEKKLMSISVPAISAQG